ncbi:MAG: helix-turn-helix transcriptional regulator [Lachnospiraceae bacterium]|nr:helix-turn-helix transcriptional regulator [Lachnospiraceae bacterium]
MNYEALGKRIREIRLLQHYTQVDVAEQLHYSEKHIGNIERGDARPSLECLVCIANTLHVSTDYLLQDSLSSGEHDISYEVLTTVTQFVDQQQLSIQNLQKKLDFVNQFSSF